MCDAQHNLHMHISAHSRSKHRHTLPKQGNAFNPSGCACVCFCGACRGWKESGVHIQYAITQMRIMSHTNITFTQDVFVCVYLGGLSVLWAVLGFTVYHLITRTHTLNTQRSTDDTPHNIFSSVLTFLKYPNIALANYLTPLNSSWCAKPPRNEVRHHQTFLLLALERRCLILCWN